MSLETILHALLQPEGRFIKTPGQPESVARLPVFTYGDNLPFRAAGWNAPSISQGSLVNFDLTPYYVEMTLGARNEKPHLGFWTIAFDGGDASTPISVQATAIQVQAALSTSSVAVSGVPGNLVITSSGVGARSVPVVTFSGDVSVTPLVTEIAGGGANEFAQWRVELPEVAPASIPFDGWTSNSQQATSTVEATPGSGDVIWRVTVDPEAASGFFRLRCNSNYTRFIPLGSSPQEVQDAVRALPGTASGAIVMTGNFTGCTYVIAFTGDTDLEIDDSGLQVPASLSGIMDLNTEGVRDLLGEENSVPAWLTLAVYDATTGALITFAQDAVTVAMPVQRPTDFSGITNLARLASIDLVDMATGLWHTVTLEGTNAAPTFEIGAGVVYVDQKGPIFIQDEEMRSCYMLTIHGGTTVEITPVKAQGLPLNASFQPRPFALRSPENANLYCPIQITPPAEPAFADPGTLVIGSPA